MAFLRALPAGAGFLEALDAGLELIKIAIRLLNWLHWLRSRVLVCWLLGLLCWRFCLLDRSFFRFVGRLFSRLFIDQSFDYPGELLN